MAFCLFPLLALFFGIFEYGRFMMDRNLMDNAVRAACRLALVYNTDSNLLGPGSPYISGTTTTVTDTVNTLLGGRQYSDLTALPVITITGNQASTGTNAVYLSGNAASSGSTLGISGLGPGDSITVSVTATYKFILPILIYVPNSVPLNSSVTMLCEGGT